MKEFGKNLKENVRGLVQTLKEKRYRAQLVRRVHIPKGDGKTRLRLDVGRNDRGPFLPGSLPGLL
ncbi:MAG: hypothetical protein A2W19_00435 [Spirochaetes bacterium RBG_16_49_21]|nr:MAG: hypothetical protein A2W19_00435 [Spirochaetes bacterium RBG_16_49_21]